MFQCPKCHNTDCPNLVIRASVRCTIDVYEDESVADYEVGDLEWKETDDAWCNDCEWSGTVKDMTIEETEDEEVDA